MNWSDERYVRCYTRDTADWLALSFDAQALFVLLLRKVDRSGVLPFGRHGTRAVAYAIGHREQWGRLEPALAELATDGCVAVRDDHLVIRNFVAAQESVSSDRKRCKEWRERRRDVALDGDDTKRVAADTKRVEPDTKRVTNDTQRHAATRGDTRRHDATRSETHSRAVPCCAVPNQKDDGAAAPAAAAASAVIEQPSSKTEPRAEPKPRAPSPAQVLAEELAEARRKAVPGVADDVALGPAAINKAFGPLLVTPGAEAIRAAWRIFLGDSWARGLTPPFPLQAFLSSKKLPGLLAKAKSFERRVEPQLVLRRASDIRFEWDPPDDDEPKEDTG